MCNIFFLEDEEGEVEREGEGGAAFFPDFNFWL